MGGLRVEVGFESVGSGGNGGGGSLGDSAGFQGGSVGGGREFGMYSGGETEEVVKSGVVFGGQEA